MKGGVDAGSGLYHCVGGPVEWHFGGVETVLY